MENLSTIDLLPAIQTEKNVEKLLLTPWSKQHCNWYKNLNGEYLSASSHVLDMVTAKPCSSLNQIISKNDYQLQSQRYQAKADTYLANDKSAYENGAWLGLEACHYQNSPFMTVSYKKAIINNNKEIIGIFGFILNFISYPSIKSIINKFDLDTELFCGQKRSTVDLLTCNNSMNLTQREIECLYYTLRGKSAKSIANVLKLSSKTIEYYIQQLKIKFEVLTKAQLIDKAITLGYLEKIPLSLVYNN
ncbi:MAG: helix-turn-helix transcriptional regulator [Gammaproteobacteria bacterium]